MKANIEEAYLGHVGIAIGTQDDILVGIVLWIILIQCEFNFGKGEDPVSILVEFFECVRSGTGRHSGTGVVIRGIYALWNLPRG